MQMTDCKKQARNLLLRDTVKCPRFLRAAVDQSQTADLSRPNQDQTPSLLDSDPPGTRDSKAKAPALPLLRTASAVQLHTSARLVFS